MGVFTSCKQQRLYLLCSLQHPETGPKLSLKVKGSLHPKESTRGLTPPNGLGLVCCSTSAILASEFFAQHRNSDSKQVRISFHHTSAPAVQSRRGPLSAWLLPASQMLRASCRERNLMTLGQSSLPPHWLTGGQSIPLCRCPYHNCERWWPP